MDYQIMATSTNADTVGASVAGQHDTLCGRRLIRHATPGAMHFPCHRITVKDRKEA
jgi:hypothetical protein